MKFLILIRLVWDHNNERALLDFERPLAEIIEKIEALQAASNEDPELLGQIEKLRKEEEKLKIKFFLNFLHGKKFKLLDTPETPYIRLY